MLNISKIVGLTISMAVLSSNALAGAFELNDDPNGVSNLSFPFWDMRNARCERGASTLHTGADEYALDCNKGAYDDDFGIDIYSVMGGEVIFQGFKNYYGKQVIVLSPDEKFAVRYAHLNTIDAAEGQIVDRRHTIIGTVGDTGLSGTCNPGLACPHLHVALYKNLNTTDIERLRNGGLPDASRAAEFKLDKWQRPYR